MTSVRSNYEATSTFFDSAVNVECKLIEEKNSRTGEVKKYSRGNFLGKGGFARCYELTDLSTQFTFAAKIIPKASLVKSRAKSKLLSEIKIHHSLSHPRVVKFHHYFEDEENVYILLEVCQNQTLNDMIKRRKRISDIEMQNYLLQLIDGLQYIHANRVIHRDLKLGNLFLSDKMELKLGDFGLATKLDFEGERKKTICGTPNYIAPEILDGKCGHSFEVDLWSVGVIMFTLLVGKPPFETSDVKTTYKRIKAVSFSFPDNVTLSFAAKDLISKLLVREPEKRLSFEQILKHEFMNPSYSIPRVLPVSTIAVPLNAAYIKSLSSNKENYPNLKVEEVNPRISIGNLRLTKETFYPPAKKQTEDNFPKNSSPRIQSPRKMLNTSSETKNYEINVVDWVDYSNKYGVGYILGNGVAGVYFNDATKMLIDGASKLFIYFDRKAGEKEDSATLFTTDGYPSELHKKLTLLQHFKNHLEEKSGKTSNKAILHPSDGSKQIYVKKWLKTKHAILFRLSNKLVQVVFQDGTTIYLSTELKTVYYLNKKKEKLKYPLSTAMDADNPEMVKRLKYTKNLLNLMLHKNGRAPLEDEPDPNGFDGEEVLKGQREKESSRENLKQCGTVRRSIGFSREREETDNQVFRMASLARFSPEKFNKF